MARYEGDPNLISYAPHDPPERFHSWHLPEDEAMDWLREAIAREMECDEATEECRSTTFDLVICEGIRITAKTAQTGDEVQASIRQIGVAGALCRWAQVPFLVQPAGAYGFAHTSGKKDFAKLKKLGWYRKGVDHPNAAAGHLLLYLSENCEVFRYRLVGS